MSKSASFLILLSLLSFVGCTTDKEVLVRTEFIKSRVPPALLQPPPPAWRKQGGPETTQDFVARGDHNESALNVCSARLSGIKAWDEQTLLPVADNKKGSSE